MQWKVPVIELDKHVRSLAICAHEGWNFSNRHNQPVDGYLTDGYLTPVTPEKNH